MTSVLNPYAVQLGTLNPREVMADTPHRLKELLGRLAPDGLNRSLAPGKWTARVILCHLADCEIAFAFRLRQALAESNHVIQPFDQDGWAKPYDSDSLQATTAVQVFSVVRGWNLILLNTLSPDAFSKPLRHPERGDMTFQTIVETMAGHDRNHLSQLEEIAGSTERVSAY